ncbi:alpha/beta hydrolase [soil metagenome]
MTSPGLDHTEDLVRSFDGTFITARRMGEDKGAELPLLVANAIGANLAIWRGALADVVTERTVVTWDHRGFYGSGAPASDRSDAAAHAEDALAVADHFDIDRFAVASWSNGALIALELARSYPGSVSALALVCGGYGHPLERLVRHFELASLLPVAAGVGRRLSPLLQVGFRLLASRPELPGIIRQSGMVAAGADTVALADLVRGMAESDLGYLLRSYEKLMAGGNAGLVDGISVPTLLVAAERDQFTSQAMMREMAEAIPGARLEVYEDATHYLPIERPARLSQDLRGFLASLD